MFIVYGKDTSKQSTYQPVNLRTGKLVRISQASKVPDKLKDQALKNLEAIKKTLPANIDLQLFPVPKKSPLLPYY